MFREILNDFREKEKWKYFTSHSDFDSPFCLTHKECKDEVDSIRPFLSQAVCCGEIPLTRETITVDGWSVVELGSLPCNDLVPNGSGGFLGGTPEVIMKSPSGQHYRFIIGYGHLDSYAVFPVQNIILHAVTERSHLKIPEFVDVAIVENLDKDMVVYAKKTGSIGGVADMTFVSRMNGNYAQLCGLGEDVVDSSFNKNIFHLSYDDSEYIIVSDEASWGQTNGIPIDSQGNILSDVFKIVGEGVKEVTIFTDSGYDLG